MRRRPTALPLASLLSAVLLSLSPSRAAAEGGPAVAIAAELAAENGRTRLTVTLSRSVPVSGFVLEGPDRAVIELPEVNFQLPPEAGRRRVGLVGGFRSGLFAPGRSRIVVELAAPAQVARSEVVDGPAAGVKHLVLEFARTDRESFRRAASMGAVSMGAVSLGAASLGAAFLGAGREARSDPEVTGSIGVGVSTNAAAATAAVAATTDVRPVIVLDAGHGGVDPGAKSASGALEKDVVLAFAKSFRDRLVAGGRFKVVMTRDDDTFVPLDERVRRAREAGADLFVSIHADHISSPSVRGATVYTGAERATDAESAKLADRENAADATAGLPARAPDAAVSDILHDLTARETRGFSHRFAHLVLSGTTGAMRWGVQPHREAGFRVLRAHDVPAVLVELGYLSNAKEAGLLASEPWRQRAVAAMAGAVERFFGARPGLRAAMSP